MNRILGKLNRRGSHDAPSPPTGDSPEAVISREVSAFCESGGPNNAGDEYLHLPAIVESAESSPAAAKEAANRIRKFLSKENYNRANVQYNSIMLARILVDNPGKSFTRNLDGKFINTVKELLKEGKDLSVQQILRETLDSFETEKSSDENLSPLLEMWKKEKVKTDKRLYGQNGQPLPRVLNAPPFDPRQQNYFARNHRPRGLPPPDELAARIEEAKTSAKLLLQVVQSTPTNDVLNNDLIKEFADRCQSASRSVQGYIHSDNPAPDEDTLLTLIETNDQLSVAMSKHQRALLQARRANPTSPPPQTASGAVILGPPPVPGPRRTQSPPTKTSTPENPFADPHAHPQGLVGSSNPAAPDLQAPLQPQDQAFEPPAGPPPQQQRQPVPMGGGFRPTASYMGRQDSAINHTTMHGGGPPPVSEENPTLRSGEGPVSPMESSAQPAQGIAYRY